MANNRVTYATAQFSVKDNRMDATNIVIGTEPDGTLASGVATTDGEIAFNEALQVQWPAAGMFRVKVGSAEIEYIRYSSFLDTNTVGGLTRGAAGTTVNTTLPSGTVAQLGGWEVPLGMQSVTIDTTFNVEDVFTIGQLDAYQAVEGIPEVEVTAERLFDGTKPLWLMVTDPDFTTLKGRTANYKADLGVNVYPDTQDSAIGTADSVVVVSGSFISAWSANFAADDNFTESITMVANDKTWGGQEGTPSGYFPASDSYDAEVIGSGVQRSENFNRTISTLPAEIPADDHIQSINVSVDITREDIFRLGQKTPFFRSVVFPVTVTTTFETITDKGDLVNALGTGAKNLTNRNIVLKTDEGLTIDLGTKNKLNSVSFGGFDAGGGNATVTYEFTNSNALTVTHNAFLNAFDTNQDLPNAPAF